MINANLDQFLDNGWYNEAVLYYKGFSYFCEGNWNKGKKEMKFVVYKYPSTVIDDIYVKIKKDGQYEKVYEDSGEIDSDIKTRFLTAKIFDGHSFWEVEKDIAWYDEML